MSEKDQVRYCDCSHALELREKLVHRNDLISYMTDATFKRGFGPKDDYVVLECVVRRGSPLHKLWQEEHLKRYPGDY